MENEKKHKYDYSSLESQRLLTDFTKLLADLTLYSRELEGKVLSLELEIQEKSRVRYMVKEIIIRTKNLIARVIMKIFRRRGL